VKIWGISDLHLCITDPEKKMDIFGDNWIDHGNKIRNNWKNVVGDDDIVLIPGDICWAMRLLEGIKELEFLVDLPGEKVFVKGNHDFWWDSINKVRKNAPARMHFIQNDSVVIGEYGFAGTRLWDYEFVKWPCVFTGREDQIPETKEVSDNWLAKVRKREFNRLENSLKSLPIVKHKFVCFLLSLCHSFQSIGNTRHGPFVENLAHAGQIKFYTHFYLLLVAKKPSVLPLVSIPNKAP